MVVTITYRPSDIEAVRILKRIKTQLGISGRIDTIEERRKAYYYLKSKGWNMSMLACNPDVYPGTPEDKALCMLFDEMRSYQMQETEKGNEEQLKKYGSAFRSTYEKNKKIFGIQKTAIESAIKGSGMRQLMLPMPVVVKRAEKNLNPIPKPLPMPKPQRKPPILGPLSNDRIRILIEKNAPTTATAQQSVHPSGPGGSKLWLLVGLGVLVFLLMRR